MNLDFRESFGAKYTVWTFTLSDRCSSLCSKMEICCCCISSCHAVCCKHAAVQVNTLFFYFSRLIAMLFLPGKSQFTTLVHLSPSCCTLSTGSYLMPWRNAAWRMQRKASRIIRILIFQSPALL